MADLAPPAALTDKPAAGRRLLARCLTPREALPGPLLLSISLATWAILLLGWTLSTYAGWLPSLFVPSPSDVVARAITMWQDGSLVANAEVSLEVVLIGFVLSSLLAVPCGMLVGTFPVVKASVGPVVEFMRYLPVTAFVPLFILWIGIGLDQRVAVIFFGTFFQQLVMVADLTLRVPDDMLNAAYTLGASRRDTLLHVLLPAALPGVLDTLRVTMGWAWTYVVVAELVGASSGLGYMSMTAMRGFQVDTIFLAVGVIGLLGLVSDQLIKLVSFKLTGWAR